MKLMRLRTCTIFGMLLAWLASLCVLSAPAHACCKLPDAQKALAQMPCCMVQPVTQPDFKHSTPGFDTPPGLVILTPLVSLFPRLEVPTATSRLAHAYIPDQSGRHLELSILLN